MKRCHSYEINHAKKMVTVTRATSIKSLKSCSQFSFFAVRMVPEDGSHFTVTTDLEPTTEFLAWIFSLGSAAEILEPRTVRTSMSFKLMMENWKYDK